MLRLAELSVGASDDFGGVGVLIAQNQRGHRFRPAGAFDADDATCFDLGLAIERGLQVVRVYVQPGGGDDHVFFAAFEKDVPFGVHLAHIAGS